MKILKWFFLFTIFSLALFFRGFDLSSVPAGLHWDELDTGYQAFSLLKTGKDYFGNPFPLFPHSIADFRTPVFIYANVPFVALLGLTPVSVRLTPMIFGMLAVVLMYILARRFLPDTRYSWIAPLVLALSPWHVLYSRTSVECISMLTLLLVGVVAFYKSLTRPAWFWVSGLFFGLSVAAYSPAKFFSPLLFAFVLFSYRRNILRFTKRRIIISFLLFGLFAVPIIYDGFFGQSSLRFRDLSIFTDPTVASQVNYRRQNHQLASGQPRLVGMRPGLFDKILINKPVMWFTEFTKNYLGVFSPEYLFLQGDQELRHSPSPESIGQLHLIEILPLILGIFALTLPRFISGPNALVLLFWLLIGPVSSSLTRGGGPHAARTFLMLPAFVLLITLGIKFLASRIRLFVPAYLLLFTGSSFYIFSYFFTDYRFEGLKPFQWGFDRAVVMAVKYAPVYDHVVLDMHLDNGLMSYLFTTKFPPHLYQSMQPLSVTNFFSGIQGNTFGNITILFPGTRIWGNHFSAKEFPARTLLITAADQTHISEFPRIDQIDYPDLSPAFYAIAR